VFPGQNSARRLAGGEGKWVGEHDEVEGYLYIGLVGARDGRSWAVRGSSGAAAWRWLAGGRPAWQGQGAMGNQFRGLTRVEVEQKVGLDGEAERRR
jgi:hypothetical protein